MFRHHVERETQGNTGRVLLEHGTLGLTDHLNIAHRIVKIVHLEVEIIDAQGLLKLGGVLMQRDRHNSRAVVKRIVPPDLVRPVGEALWMFVVSRHEE